MSAKLESRDDLVSWEAYRAFMKERLKQLPEGDCPFYLSKQKVEFEIEGKPWMGYAVLLGPKGELAVKKLRKEGVQFREGTCRQEGKDFEVQGIPANLVEFAELTFKKLRLGYSLAGATEDEDPRDEGSEGGGEDARPAGGVPDADAGALGDALQELVGKIKAAAALRVTTNADVLKRAATRASEAEAARGRGDLAQVERLVDEIEELLTEVEEGPDPGEDEDPGLAGLGDWGAYRRFMKAHLKRLPPEGGPFFVSRKKVDFSVEGKAFKGFAVLLGEKARITVLALKKEGTIFVEGSCRREGKEILVEGIPTPLVKGARKTFIELRLGRKIVPVDDAPSDDPGDNREEGGSPSAGSAQRDEPPMNMTRPFEIGASVGRGGRNDEEDVQAVQIALNRRTGAGLAVDGRCTPATIAAIVEFQKALGQSRPDGRVDPGRGTARALAASGRVGPAPPPPRPMAPPDLGPPALDRAPAVWHGTRVILDNNIRELKRAILQEYSNEHPDLLVEIDRNVKRVDVILERLDQRLGRSLERANAATDDGARRAELKNARAIVAEYIQYVKTEPLIGHIDRNPFGVDTKLKRVITDSLTHMARSIG